MTVKTVESVEIGFRSRWTSVEVVNSRDGHRSTWFRSKWKSVEVTYNRLKSSIGLLNHKEMGSKSKGKVFFFFFSSYCGVL